MKDLSGQKTKGYELIEQIAAGGQGAVYRAKQTSVDREVAIKVILPELANEPEFIRRFEAEAHFVARLEHPHIVPLHDYWREPGGAYLVMRWLPEGSLRNQIENGGLDINQISKFLRQVGSALSEAHHQGVVHRDIKPENIMLDAGGNFYLSDFGIAKDISDGKAVGLTGTGIIGTLPYLSPEQAKSEKVSPQSDIYNLGVLLYELLAGEHPFAGEDPIAIIMHHISDPLPSLKDKRPELPKNLDTVIRKATAKSAKKRYKTAEELSSAYLNSMRGKLDEDQLINLPAIPEKINPYKGLRAFQEADGDDFFGRETLIKQLVTELKPSAKNSRFLALVGPSGSGKSSVVKAGLLPQIRKGALPGSEKWFISDMQPGSHPLDELEIALLSVSSGKIANVREQLERDERGLVRMAQLVLPKDDTELFLVIDQFEELFTLVENQADQKHFLDLLISANTDKRSRVRMLITLRADFYDKPLMFPGFSEMMRDRTSVIIPLSADELSRAIVEPAKRADVEIESDLVAEIVSDVVEQPGALPLLQYALTELFEISENEIIKRQAYQAIGGVLGALGNRAQDIQDNLSEEGQAISRQVFLRLVALGEGTGDTRRRAFRNELEGLDLNAAQLDDVINAFGDARLLTFDRDPLSRAPTVEVAHEALLREWPHLRDWLDASRADVNIQRRIAVASNEWRSAKKDVSFLLRGSRLDQFELWQKDTDIALSKAEREFLDASLEAKAIRDEEETEREAREAALEKRSGTILRVLVGVFAVAAVGALLLSNFAFGQQAIAEENGALAATSAAEAQSEADLRATQQALAEQQANLAISRELSQSAFLNLEKDPELSMLLALQALDVEHTIEAENVLHQAVQSSRVRQTFMGHKDAIWNIEYSPDGSRLAARDNEDIIKIWDVATGEILVQIQTPENIEEMIVFSPDGSRLAGGNETGEVVIWDTSDGSELLTLQADAGTIRMIDFSPDGAYLVTASDYAARLVVWDAVTGEEVVQLENTSAEDGADHIFTHRMGFTPDGKHLAYMKDANGGEVNNLLFFETETWQKVATINNVPLGPIAFNPVDNVIATISAIPIGNNIGEGVVGFHRYDLSVQESTYDPFIVAKVGTSRIVVMKFSADGSHFLSVTSIEEPTFWKVTPNELELAFMLSGHYTTVYALDVSPDGQHAATGSRDGVIRIWDISQKGAAESLSFLIDEGLLVSRKVLYTPDGSRFITSGGAEAAKVWDAATGQMLMELSGHQGYLKSLAISPEGTQAATAGDDAIGRIYDLNNGEVIVNLTGHEEIASQDGTLHGIYSIQYSPDGSLIATAGIDGTARLWDSASGEEIFMWQVMPDSRRVFAAVFSPDGSELAVGTESHNSEDGKGVVKIYDLETYEEVHVITGEEISGFIVFNGLTYSPDGTLLAIAGELPASLTMWDTESREVKYRLGGITNFAVLAAVFSPDGNWLYVPTPEGVSVYDVETGMEVIALPSNGGIIHGASISPDGTKFVTLDISGLLKVQVLELDAIVDIARTRLTRALTSEECVTYLHMDECPR
jgi:WD40 repeat protein/serine/threonine protein kinase